VKVSERTLPTAENGRALVSVTPINSIEIFECEIEMELLVLVPTIDRVLEIWGEVSPLHRIESSVIDTLPRLILHSRLLSSRGRFARSFVSVSIARSIEGCMEIVSSLKN
jgi:hypothetical protein